MSSEDKKGLHFYEVSQNELGNGSSQLTMYIKKKFDTTPSKDDEYDDKNVSTEKKRYD